MWTGEKYFLLIYRVLLEERIRHDLANTVMYAVIFFQI